MFQELHPNFLKKTTDEEILWPQVSTAMDNLLALDVKHLATGTHL